CERIVRNMAGAPWDPGDIALGRADARMMLGKIAAEWKGAAALDLTIADPEAEFSVLAPPVGLGQAVMNLLRNAEEASPRGGTIDIGLSVRGPFVEISVSDRGPGVDPGVLDALGTPFNSRKGEGRGLGLFAALHFAESLGGALALEARPGGGAVARLALPRPSRAAASG